LGKIQLLRAALAPFGRPALPKEVAGRFRGRRTTSRIAQVARLLETLAALGQAEAYEDGQFTAV
jgi:hypothetical protein